MKISYRLLELNRKVLVQIGAQSDMLLYRDLAKIIKLHGGILANNKIYGSGYLLDVSIKDAK